MLCVYIYIYSITSVCDLHSYPLPYLVCDHNNLIVSYPCLVVTGVSPLLIWLEQASLELQHFILYCMNMNMYAMVDQINGIYLANVRECGNLSCIC